MFSANDGHPGTALLVAWLDGELGAWRRWRIQRHIAQCWACRGRLGELESTIRQLGPALAQECALPETEIHRAKWRLRGAIAAFEASQPRPHRRLSWRLAAAGVTAALALTVGWSVSRRHPAPVTVSSSRPPVSPVLLKGAVRAEMSTANANARSEDIRVEIVRPGKPVVEREWQVWTAPSRRLYASRWRDNRGVLRDAVYASRSTDSWAFTQSQGLRPATFVANAAYSPLYSRVVVSDQGDDALEARVVDWVREQAWQPVSLAREVSEFCSRTGATLRVTRVRDGWRLEAAAPVHGTMVGVVLETAASGDMPRLLELSWHTPAGEERMRFRRVRAESYASADLVKDYLRPERSFPRHSEPIEKQPREAVLAPLPDLLPVEVRILKAIHQARLCGTDAIRVEQREHAVEVDTSLLAPGEQQRLQELVRAAVDPALVTWRPVAAPEQRSEATMILSPHAGVPARTPAAGERWLRTRLQVGQRSSERDMYDLMNLLVRESDEMLGAAWPLEELARRFPVEREARLDETSRAELRAMVAEHCATFSQHLASLGAVLAAIDIAPSPLNRTTGAGRRWQEIATDEHLRARRTSELVLHYFAASRESRVVEAPASPEDSELAELVGQLRALATAARAAAESVAWSR